MADEVYQWYFVTKENTQSEPTSTYELLEKIVNNDGVTAETLVWRNGLDQWTAFMSIPELLEFVYNGKKYEIIPHAKLANMSLIDQQDYLHTFNAWVSFMRSGGSSDAAFYQNAMLDAQAQDPAFTLNDAEDQHFKTEDAAPDQSSESEGESEESEEEIRAYASEHEYTQESAESEDDYDDRKSKKKKKASSKKKSSRRRRHVSESEEEEELEETEEEEIHTSDEEESEEEVSDSDDDRSHRKKKSKAKAKKSSKKPKKKEKKEKKEKKLKPKKSSKKRIKEESDDEDDDSHRGKKITSSRLMDSEEEESDDYEDYSRSIRSVKEKEIEGPKVPKTPVELYQSFNMHNTTMDTKTYLTQLNTAFPTLRQCFQSIKGCNAHQNAKKYLAETGTKPTDDPNKVSALVQYHALEECFAQYTKDEKGNQDTMNDNQDNTIVPNKPLYLPSNSLFVPTHPYATPGAATLADILSVQVRRSQIYKYYSRAWFPVWCIGQYTVVAGKLGRIVDFSFIPKSPYNLQVPIDPLKPQSGNTDVQMTLYFVVAFSGEDNEWKTTAIPLTAISNTKVDENLLKAYIERITNFRVIRNAVNAWFSTKDGNQFFTDKKGYIEQRLEEHKKEHPGASESDLYCTIITLIPNAHQEVFGRYRKQAPPTLPSGMMIKQDMGDESKQEPGANGQPTDGNQENEEELLISSIGQRNYDLMRKKYYIEEKHMALEQIESISSHHTLSYFPSTVDIKRLQGILHVIASERIIPERKQVYSQFINTMKTNRGWNYRDTTFVKLEDYKIMKARYAKGELAEIDDTINPNLKTASNAEREQYCKDRVIEMTKLIKELTEFEHSKEQQRDQRLAAQTITKAGELNKRARTTNKQRFNSYIQETRTISLTDAIYHENTNIIHKLVNDPNAQPPQQQYSTTAHSVHHTAGSAMKFFAGGLDYKTSDKQVEEKDLGMPIKRKKLSFGRVLAANDKFVQLSTTLLPKLAIIHAHPEHKSQPFKRFDMETNGGHHGMVKSYPLLPGLSSAQAAINAPVTDMTKFVTWQQYEASGQHQQRR